MRPLRLAAVATTTLAVAAALAVPALASEAKATITWPTSGSSVSGTSVTVKGGYSATATVKEVRVAICKVGTNGACTAYLSNAATGDFVSTYRSLPATLTPKTQVSGTYQLAASKLTAGPYKAAAFVVSNDTPKGPSTTVNFTMKASEPPSTKGYITITFGRSNWSVATGATCNVIPSGARTLEQNVQDLAARGLMAQGGVVVDRTHATARECTEGQMLQPSWADLTRLRVNNGFTVVSQGMTYADMTKMTTDAQRYNESGATLPIFNSRGHTRAWGMFNYPNNKMDAAANRVVTKYFAFGRKYGTEINNRAAVMTYPYLVKTISVMGGRCNNVNLACYTMSVKNNKQMAPPERLSRILRPGADQWGVVQFYRIVEGSYGRMGASVAWDCTSSDWRNRWTSQPEIYCRNSFLEAIDGRSKTAVNADAVDVAKAWGRTPG